MLFFYPHPHRCHVSEEEGIVNRKVVVQASTAYFFKEVVKFVSVANPESHVDAMPAAKEMFV